LLKNSYGERRWREKRVSDPDASGMHTPSGGGSKRLLAAVRRIKGAGAARKIRDPPHALRRHWIIMVGEAEAA